MANDILYIQRMYFVPETFDILYISDILFVAVAIIGLIII